jgi:thymidylate synthase
MSGSGQIYNHYYSQVEGMLAKYWKKDEGFYDPRGNFIIEISNEEIIVKLVHPESNIELKEFRGKTAEELMDKVSLSAIIINTRHAIYLGTELVRAESALKNNKPYEQDK